jgi:hypothetical protein
MLPEAKVGNRKFAYILATIDKLTLDKAKAVRGSSAINLFVMKKT